MHLNSRFKLAMEDDIAPYIGKQVLKARNYIGVTEISKRRNFFNGARKNLCCAPCAPAVRFFLGEARAPPAQWRRRLRL